METKKQRGSVVKNCKQCGNEFSVAMSTLAVGKGNCCSKACDNEFRIGKPKPKYKTRCDKKPRTSCVCQLCGKVFIDEHAERPRKFCSNQCLGRSKKKRNSSRPRQKLSSKLLKWSCSVILRDKACIRCGATENLQAHHIIEYANHPELALDLGNGVTLCPPCHHSQHPKHSLAFYVKRGGQTVQRCVVCEGPFVSRKQTQRTCNVGCGAKLRQAKRTYLRKTNDE